MNKNETLDKGVRDLLLPGISR